MSSPWSETPQMPLRSRLVPTAPRLVRFAYHRGRLLRYVIFAGVLVIAGIWLLFRTDDWQTRLWSLALVAFAAAVVIVYTRKMLGGRTAIALSAHGLSAQHLGPRMIPWSDIEHVRMRWEKRTLLWVIPLDVASLAISVNIDSAFWKTGLLRRMSRWLSKVSEDHEVRVPLVGLDGGEPERVIEAIRTLHPLLVRETIITEIGS